MSHNYKRKLGAAADDSEKTVSSSSYPRTNLEKADSKFQQQQQPQPPPPQQQRSQSRTTNILVVCGT
jgi:hypothetical protein